MAHRTSNLLLPYANPDRNCRNIVQRLAPAIVDQLRSGFRRTSFRGGQARAPIATQIVAIEIRAPLAVIRMFTRTQRPLNVLH